MAFRWILAVKGVLGEGVAFRVILPRVDEPSAEVVKSLPDPLRLLVVKRFVLLKIKSWFAR